MASNTMQFSIEASSRRDKKKKRRSYNSVRSRRTRFRYIATPSEPIALIAVNDEKKYSLLSRRYCNV